MEKIQGFDLKILLYFNSYFAKHGGILNKLFAEYLIYLLPLALICLWFFSEKAKKVALRALFAAILAWPILANIIGRLIDRARPFEITGVKELVFHRPDYSFPSDHAAALFAIGFSLWFSGFKKLALTVFLLAVVISFFRVATGIHWPTDILGGIAVGFIAAYLIDLFDKPLDIIYNFLIKIARFLRLA